MNPGAAGELAAGPGSRGPCSAGTAWGARRGHRGHGGHGCREYWLVAGREGARAKAALVRGLGRREVGRGPGLAGLPGQGAQTGAAVPGPRRPTSGGGRSAPFVRVFQAGRLPPFPLPEFSFSVGEAPAQLEGEGVGEGVPEAGCP